MSKNNSNFPVNPYKHSSLYRKDNSPAENKTPVSSEFFQIPNEVKESIDITDRGSIKSVISDMSITILKPESTGSNYNKVEKMCNDCVARNDIFSHRWIYYGPKRDILDYWETLIFCLLF